MPRRLVSRHAFRMPDASAARSGFTLIEMVVVVLIVGVMWSVAVPRFSALIHEPNVRAAAFRIAAELNLARHDAKTKGINREVEFDVGNDRYDLLGMTHPDEPGESYRVELDEGAYPVILTVADFANAANTKDKIRFDMYGRPSSDDEPLVSGLVTVQSDSASASVIVDPVTGKAAVQ